MEHFLFQEVLIALELMPSFGQADREACASVGGAWDSLSGRRSDDRDIIGSDEAVQELNYKPLFFTILMAAGFIFNDQEWVS